MVTIVRNLKLSDQIRSSIVCKSWRSMLVNNSIPSNELPWLLLPQSPNFKKDKTLSFVSLSNSKVVDLELPKSIQGGWFCGSSEGWLIMFKESGLNSQMFLVNPISQALHQLPSYANIPSFHRYVNEGMDKKLYDTNFVFQQVLLSDSDISTDRCVVAANCSGELWLCRPRDDSWGFFDLFKDEEKYKLDISKLLFSKGKLYVLVDGDIRRDRIENQTLKFGDYELELIMVYVDIDCIRKPLRDPNNYDHIICFQFNVWPFLVESINNDVLLIYKVFDNFFTVNNNANEDEEKNNLEAEVEEGDGNDNVGEEEADGLDQSMEDIIDDIRQMEFLDRVNAWKERMYARTGRFHVYKVNSKSDENNVYSRVRSLGDQSVFLADDGSMRLSTTEFKDSEKDCIYFATKGTREIGVFFLKTGKVQRPFPGFNFITRTRISWYHPSL